MSLIRRLLPGQNTEARSFNAPIDWSTLLAGGSPSASGQIVTPESAARNAAVTACQRVLTTTVASLPVDVVRNRGRSRQFVPSPPVVTRPTPQRRRQFVAQTMKSMLSDGQGYWQVVAWDANARPTGLQTIRPQDVTWSTGDDGTFRPKVKNKPADLYPLGTLVHIPASPFVQPGTPLADSPVMLAKQSIGTALAAEEFGARFFGDGYHPTVLARSDQELTFEQAKTIKERLNAMRTSREPGVFGSGLELERWEVNPSDSQFIDLLRFEVEQCCRFFGVPPSMVYAAVSGQNVTYANVSQADLQYLKHSVGIWLLDIEDAWSELLPAGQSVKFNVDALLRMDATARHDLYKVRLESKTTTVNEIKALEDEDPYDDPEFDAPGIPGDESTPIEEEP